jgi:(p)ppGpp synthase/HD superfamily hydrolase
MPTRLSRRFEAALLLATRLHATQTRKGGRIPYVSHLLGVASLALEHGADEDVAVAALLHDAVEDRGGRPTLARIRRRFGARVAEIVEGCTDTDTVPKPEWRTRKERYLGHLDTASAEVRLVSACDKLHNARAILADYRVHGEALWKRFKGGRDGTLWYYRSLVQAFRRHGVTPLVAELARVVAEVDELAAARGAAREEK